MKMEESKMKKLKKFILVATSVGLMTSTALSEEVLRFATWDSGESLEIQQKIAKRFE